MLLLDSMQTQCPHCQTLFHVTDEQLQAADGQVRCGQCDEVFTADIISTPDAPVLSEINNPELSIEELSIDDLDDIQLDVVSIEVPELDSSDDNNNEPSITETDLTRLIEQETKQETEQEEPSVKQNQPNLRLVNTDKPVIDTHENESQTELNPIQTNTLSIDTSLSAANGEHDAQTMTDEIGDLSDDGYDPSELYPELQTTPSIQTSMPFRYILISTILILLFIAQSIFLLRDNLAERGFRPLMQSLCASLDCDLALPRAPNNIILKSREIRSHPNIKNALSVKATITNQAKFRQAFPILQIQFHDIEGRIIAGRDFLPKQYLPDDINLKQGIAPNNLVNISLELVDPGKNAVSFLFIFK